MTSALKATLKTDAHRAHSIEAEAEWMEACGSLYYNLSGPRKRAQPGCWLYLIKQGQLAARSRVVRFEYLDHPKTVYGYDGHPYQHQGWQLEYSGMELARVRLPMAGFQGCHYVTPEEAGPFARAFDPTIDQWASTLPEEVIAPPIFIEGARRRIAVNAYERDRKARHLCLVYHGTRCVCCDLDMGERYGPVAEGFIHAHHLVPLSAIGHAYVLDLIADLRPACPNCHAVIHLKDPPYSVDEVRLMLKMSGSTRGSGLEEGGRRGRVIELGRRRGRAMPRQGLRRCRARM
jgi:hypothetical protein